VSKIETIRQMLATNPEITWEEEMTQMPFQRSRTGHYLSAGFRIAPREQIPTAQGLKKFSAELVKQLKAVGPTSISWCHIFPGRTEAVRMAALYFSEKDGEAPGCVETRIRVSVFPCQTMAKNIGYRGIIEIGGYQCPQLCAVSRQCSFRASSRWKTLRKLL